MHVCVRVCEGAKVCAWVFAACLGRCVTRRRVQDGGDAKLAGCSYDFRGIESMAARIVYHDRLLRVYLAGPHEARAGARSLGRRGKGWG